MKKISRRNFLKTTGVVATAAGLAACGETASSEVTSTSTSTSSEAGTALEGNLISAEPVTFTIFATKNGVPFDKEFPVWQELGKNTNVYFDGILSSADSDDAAAWNRMLASGELPDVISYRVTAELEKLASEGGLLPLNDLIKEYGPNIQAAFDKFEGFEAGCTALDGNIYEIRRATELYPAEYWWIRKDWLDELGLEIPVTVDDWHDVLLAFREKDPNGNGQTDEVPLFDRAGWKMPDEYLWLWNSSTEFYVFDGKMVFEPLEEDFKTAVTNLVQWCEEKLVDPEIFTRGPTSRDVLLGGNLGGATHDWASTANYNDTLAADIPGIHLIAVAPPADQHGNVYERTRRGGGGNIGWAISSMCKDPVTLIKFIDYMFTEEALNLTNYGIEGDTYTMDAEGNVTYTDKIMNTDSTPLNELNALGVSYQAPGIQYAAYEIAFMNPEAKKATELYDSHREWYREGEAPYADGRLKLSYSPEVADEYTKIMTPIRTYVDEKLQGWMLGTSKFEDDYDAFIQELQDRDIERAIEINQIAYETWLATQ